MGRGESSGVASPSLTLRAFLKKKKKFGSLPSRQNGSCIKIRDEILAASQIQLSSGYS